MEIPQRWFELLTRLVAVLGTLAIAGCGSTSPSAPSPVSNPPAQYPALVGHWSNGIGTSLVLHYRDTATTGGWTCSAMMDVDSQTGGTFAGEVGLTATGSSEPPCTYDFHFTASMRPDGTISEFRMDGGLGVGTCTPVSAPTFSGTVTNTDIKITITDRAMCHDIFGPVRDFERVRDTDRTLTVSLHRLTGLSAS